MMFHTSQEMAIKPSSSWLLSSGRPYTILGPCSAESEEQLVETAKQIARIYPNTLFRAGLWKPRTRPGAFEGSGEKALEWLKSVKEETGLKTITEVATPAHLEACLKAGIDMVWIGARTTVNPFSVQELADSLQGVDIPVFVKNPINPDLNLWIGAIERIQRSGIKRIAAIHRGFHSFESGPYRYAPRWELVISFRTLMKEIPMLCDVSHISGKPELIPHMAQKAMDLDMDGIMMEVHRNPSHALSDAQQQVTPSHAFDILDKLIIRSTSTNAAEEKTLQSLRARVDAVDDELLHALLNRKQLIEQIGAYKKTNGLTIFQLNRWEEILRRQKINSNQLGVDTEFIEKLYELIHAESIRIQTRLFEEDDTNDSPI